MTWEQVAAEHIGHRATLRDPRTLECVQCSRKLVIPSVVTTTVPARFELDRTAAAPPDRVMSHAALIRRSLAARQAARPAEVNGDE